MGKMVDSLNEYGWGRRTLAFTGHFEEDGYVVKPACLIGHAVNSYGDTINLLGSTNTAWETLPIIVKSALVQSVLEMDSPYSYLDNITNYCREMDIVYHYNDAIATEQDILMVCKRTDELIDEYEAAHGPIHSIRSDLL